MKVYLREFDGCRKKIDRNKHKITDSFESVPSILKCLNAIYWFGDAKVMIVGLTREA